jgi:OmpA-OmpF porin, OOP family
MLRQRMAVTGYIAPMRLVATFAAFIGLGLVACGSAKPALVHDNAASTSTPVANITPANTEPAARPPVVTSFSLDGNAVKLPGTIAFSADGAAIDETSSAVALWTVVDYLASKSSISLLRIEGHVATGTRDAQALSEKRAAATGQWLVAHGVDCKRLLAVGFGDSKPTADNATAQGRASNTRVLAINAELRGHAIGGMAVDGGGRPAGSLCP